MSIETFATVWDAREDTTGYQTSGNLTQYAQKPRRFAGPLNHSPHPIRGRIASSLMLPET